VKTDKEAFRGIPMEMCEDRYGAFRGIPMEMCDDR